MEIRFDTNGHLFSTINSYAEEFVKRLFTLHEEGNLDSIRVNLDYSVKGPSPIEFEWSQSRALPVDVSRLSESFDISDHPQYQGIKNLNQWLKKTYEKDETFAQSLRLDVERGINFTDTTKYGTRKLGVLYDASALNWEVFAAKANIQFSEVNNPIQLAGQAKRSKYLNDHLRMGAEIIILDPSTQQELLKFNPYPDDPEERTEYHRKIREDLEKANKILKDGVAKAKHTSQLGAQVVIRPVKRRLTLEPQQKIDHF